jgi:hypothetical protein
MVGVYQLHRIQIGQNYRKTFRGNSFGANGDSELLARSSVVGKRIAGKMDGGATAPRVNKKTMGAHVGSVVALVGAVERYAPDAVVLRTSVRW